MNEALFERVKDYFSGKMSHEERLLFELEVNTNYELATIFDLYQTIDKGIFDTEEYPEEVSLLRDSLKKLQEQYLKNELLHGAEQIKENEDEQIAPVIKLEKASSPVEPAETRISGAENGNIKRMKVWRSLAIAAVAIGIIAIGFIWYLQKEKDSQVVAVENGRPDMSDNIKVPDTSNVDVSKPNEYIATQDEHNILQQKKDSIQLDKTPIPTKAERETLYARNFKPDTIPSNFSDLLEEALSHFKEQEYKEAIAAIDIETIKTSLEELRPRGQLDNQQARTEKQTLFYAYYYKALSYMGDKNAEKAIPEFHNAIIKSPDRYWQDKAHWYLALACLKTGRIKEAKIWLKQVASTKKAGEYKQSALKLISELKGS